MKDYGEMLNPWAEDSPDEVKESPKLGGKVSYQLPAPYTVRKLGPNAPVAEYLKDVHEWMREYWSITYYLHLHKRVRISPPQD